MVNVIDLLYALIVLIVISVTIVSVEVLLREKYTEPTDDQSWKRGRAINWPNDKYVTYLVAPYRSKDILEEAKALIDVQYPFRIAPYGGTFTCLRRREYYLNQYLWFYKQHGRFPRYEKIVSPFPWSGFKWVGARCGYEEHYWESFDGSKIGEN